MIADRIAPDASAAAVAEDFGFAQC